MSASPAHLAVRPESDFAMNSAALMAAASAADSAHKYGARFSVCVFVTLFVVITTILRDATTVSNMVVSLPVRLSTMNGFIAATRMASARWAVSSLPVDVTNQ